MGFFTKAKKNATTSVLESVKKGQMGIDEAVKISKLPPEEQERLSAMPKSERKDALRQPVLQGAPESPAPTEKQVSEQVIGLAEEFEKLAERILAIIKEVRAGGFSEISRETIVDNIGAFNSVLNGVAPYVSPIERNSMVAA